MKTAKRKVARKTAKTASVRKVAKKVAKPARKTARKLSGGAAIKTALRPARKTAKKASAKKATKSTGAKSSFALSMHDMNSISLAAQSPRVNSEYLIRLLKDSGASAHAVDIARMVIAANRTSATTKNRATEKAVKGNTTKARIAQHYLTWTGELGAARSAKAKR